MEIHQGKKGLKEASIDAFIGEKRLENQTGKQFSFSSGPADKTLVGLPTMDTRGLEQLVEDRKAYNDSIRNLNPKYSAIEPQGSYLLRCFVYTGDEFQSDKIFIGTSAIPKVAVKNRQGADWKEIDDPFAYRGKAVIVAIPTGETTLKPGDIVQINKPRTYAPLPLNTDVLEVEHSYLHPDSPHIILPKSLKDEDFGYVLVTRSAIIARLEEA